MLAQPRPAPPRGTVCLPRRVSLPAPGPGTVRLPRRLSLPAPDRGTGHRPGPLTRLRPRSGTVRLPRRLSRAAPRRGTPSRAGRVDPRRPGRGPVSRARCGRPGPPSQPAAGRVSRVRPARRTARRRPSRPARPGRVTTQRRRSGCCRGASASAFRPRAGQPPAELCRVRPGMVGSAKSRNVHHREDPGKARAKELVISFTSSHSRTSEGLVIGFANLAERWFRLSGIVAPGWCRAGGGPADPRV